MNKFLFELLTGQLFVFYFDMGGGSAPAPDPNVGIAALKSAATGEKALQFYQDEYNRYRPQMEQAAAQAAKTKDIQNQLSQQQQTMSQEANDRYKATFVPAENKLVSDAMDYNTTGRQEADAARGLSDLQQQFDVAQGETQRNNERMGVNPNSGNAQALDAELGLSRAVAGANVATQARRSTEMTGKALLTDAVSLGRNLPATSLSAASGAGNASNAAAGSLLAANADTRASIAGQGAGYGMAMTGYNQQGNILNHDYSNRVAAYNADNNASSGMMSGLAGLGMAGARYLLSDERLKENVVYLGKENGFKVYRFTYIQGHGLPEGEHVGVLAQEVQAVRPDAVTYNKDGFLAVDYSKLGFEMKEAA